jgi:hypothetical protein
MDYILVFLKTKLIAATFLNALSTDFAYSQKKINLLVYGKKTMSFYQMIIGWRCLVICFRVRQPRISLFRQRENIKVTIKYISPIPIIVLKARVVLKPREFL